MRELNTFLILCLSLVSISAGAAEKPLTPAEPLAPAKPVSSSYPFAPVLSLGLDFGGEKILEFGYSDGSRSSIEAGKGVVFSAGVLLPVYEREEHAYEIQPTIGYKYTSSKPATNGEMTYTHVPLEVLGLYRHTELNFRIGAGFTYQLNNKITGTGDFTILTTEIKDAFGGIVQADYLVGTAKNLALGLKVTFIRYETQAHGTHASGNSVGFNMSYWFL